MAGSFETVVLEDLNVVGMVKKSTKALSRSILDAGWNELRRQLTYKTEDRGHCVVVVKRFYPFFENVLSLWRDESQARPQ